MTEASPFQFEDIQGLVRYAHGKLSETCFILLDVKDAKLARAWLQSAPVTTAVTVEPIPDRALQIAFTANGLRAMEVNEAVVTGFSYEFVAGMTEENRARRLGDIGANDPQHWQWGGKQDGTPHLLLMLYAREGLLADWQSTVTGSDFEKAFQVRTTLPTFSLGAFEPFGFTDGISQPELDWERQQSTNLHERDRYSNLLKVGEVLLGYPSEYGLYTDRPLIDPRDDTRAEVLPAANDKQALRDFGCNGSYLVLRQLSQDAPGFWKFIDAAAGSDAVERDRLAAAMVGRQRDGTPLVAASGDGKPANDFTFDYDPDGYQCPIGAHIRRVNPRTGDYPPGVTGFLSRLVRILGFGRKRPREDLIASTRFHRILRRGRAYGSLLSPEQAIEQDAPTKDSGLQFICLAANISRQFEFVQTAWSVGAKFGGVQNETDPLLGNREPLPSGESTDTFRMPSSDGPARCVYELPRFVTVKGGAYFFMPGIRALRYIAASPPTQNGTEE